MLPTPYLRRAVAARTLFYGFVFLGLLGTFPQASVAGLFTLVDDNASMTFDTSAANNATSWSVDGVNQLHQQAFWYRIGNAAEQSVHSLPIAFEVASDTNVDPNVDTLFVRYVGAGFQIDVRYSLDGGLAGSRASDMAEQISISNTGAAALDFHFFQYADFDLNGTAAGDSAFFPNSNAVRQSEGALSVSETVITPVPSHREIAFVPTTLNQLSDGAPTTLSDTSVLGAGDVSWAFQWDFVLQPGGTYQISKDKHLSGIPEPAAAMLLNIGVAMLMAARRSRRTRG
jgi:hypothetical protein